MAKRRQSIDVCSIRQTWLGRSVLVWCPSGSKFESNLQAIVSGNFLARNCVSRNGSDCGAAFHWKKTGSNGRKNAVQQRFVEYEDHNHQIQSLLKNSNFHSEEHFGHGNRTECKFRKSKSLLTGVIENSLNYRSNFMAFSRAIREF